MKIKPNPKTLLETAWKADRKQFSPDAKTPPACLRCGKPLNPCLAVNALSRHADIYICESCGTEEALQDYTGCPPHLESWHAFTCGRLPKLADMVLTPACGFSEIFAKTESDTEIAYSRSDYDGYRWWTTWFDKHPEQVTPQLVLEIDGFIGALFKTPEFESLDTMSRLCSSYAAPTNDPTEFNLYSQTDHLYIWLRLITRNKDYNLYVHFYLKPDEGMEG